MLTRLRALRTYLTGLLYTLDPACAVAEAITATADGADLGGEYAAGGLRLRVARHPELTDRWTWEVTGTDADEAPCGLSGSWVEAFEDGMRVLRDLTVPAGGAR